jgi:hypothetical protein
MSRTHKETMFEDFDYAAIDVIAAERRARELRAEAIRDAVRAAARWIAARVTQGRAVPAQRA